MRKAKTKAGQPKAGGHDQTKNTLKALKRRSNAHKEKGNHLRAGRIGMRIINLFPQDWFGYCRAAEELSKARKKKKAAKILKTALSLFPFNPKVLRSAITIYHDTGNDEKALECAKKLIDTNPSHKDTYDDILRKIKAANGRTKINEAIIYGAKRLRKQQKTKELEWLASKAIHTYEGSGSHNQIQYFANIALEINPSNATPYLSLINSYKTQGFYKRLIKITKQAKIFCADNEDIRKEWASLRLSNNIIAKMATVQPMPFRINSILEIQDGRGFAKESRCKYTTSYPEVADELQYGIINNAIINKTYGAYDEKGVQVADSILWRGNRDDLNDFPCGVSCNIKIDQSSEYDQLDSAIWIRYGHFFHFGHLITETCSSIYPLIKWRKSGIELERLNIIMHYQFRKSIPTFSEMMGISGKNIYIVGHNCRQLRIKRLYMPLPTLALRNKFSKAHGEIVRDLATLIESSSQQASQALITGQPTKAKTENIYISRSRVRGNSKKLAQEKEIEDLLEKHSWKVYHPQEHTIGSQLATYANASKIAGIEGSAFHLLIGLTRNSPEVRLLTWRSGRSSYDAQFEAQGAKYKTLQCLNIGDSRCDLRSDHDISSIVDFILS